MANGTNASRFFILLTISTACNVKSPFGNAERPNILSPGLISTADHHESLSFVSEDLTSVIFTRADQQWETSKIFKSDWSGTSWSDPQLLFFSGKDYDAGFCISPEGDRAFFTSKRNPNDSTLSPEWNIWTIELIDEKWQNPQAVEAPVNSLGSECCLTMNASGDTFFSSDRDGSWDIFAATYRDGKFYNIQKLDTLVNSENGEWPSYVHSDGSMLLFSSIRKTGVGGDDIYLTKQSDNSWTSPLLLPKINSATYEDSPLLSTVSGLLFFSSRVESDFSKGVSNIYFVESKAVLED